MKLDTRTKIVTRQEVAVLTHERPVKQVTGHFDPLLAEHARHLRESAKAGEPLLVVVTNPEAPLLPQRARAELVASLGDVDYVVMEDGPPVVEDDARITTSFVELVLSRHRGVV